MRLRPKPDVASSALVPSKDGSFRSYQYGEYPNFSGVAVTCD